MLQRYYSVLKQVNSVAEIDKGVINGYMDAGLALGVVTRAELHNVIDEASIEVFGMSIDERLESFRETKMTLDEILNVPTHIRQGRHIDAEDRCPFPLPGRGSKSE